MKHVVTIILCMITFIFAQSDSLMVVKKSDLPAALVKKLEVEQNIDNNITRVSKIAGLGKEIGTAVREGLSALNEESNKFADTKVGAFVMCLIAFKVIGYPIIQFIIGIPLVITGTIIFVMVLFRMCIPRKTLTSEIIDEKKVKTKIYNIYKPAENWYPVVAVVIYMVFLLLCTAIIFIH